MLHFRIVHSLVHSVQYNFWKAFIGYLLIQQQNSNTTSYKTVVLFQHVCMISVLEVHVCKHGVLSGTYAWYEPMKFMFVNTVFSVACMNDISPWTSCLWTRCSQWHICMISVHEVHVCKQGVLSGTYARYQSMKFMFVNTVFSVSRMHDISPWSSCL